MASESPKWIALVLSIIAITISGLSWWDSHRTLLINEEINRPVLDVSKDVNLQVFRGSPDLGSLTGINFIVPVRNVGKTTAVMNSVLIGSGLTNEGGDCGNSKMKDADTAAFSGDILPGSEGYVRKMVSLDAKCQNPSKLEFWLSLDLTYTDPINGKMYLQKLSKKATWAKETNPVISLP